jgi:hypothetical protein
VYCFVLPINKYLYNYYAFAFDLRIYAQPRSGTLKYPLKQLEGLGSAVSSPSGSGRSPAAKRFWCIMWAENGCPDVKILCFIQLLSMRKNVAKLTFLELTDHSSLSYSL